MGKVLLIWVREGFVVLLEEQHLLAMHGWGGAHAVHAHTALALEDDEVVPGSHHLLSLPCTCYSDHLLLEAPTDFHQAFTEGVLGLCESKEDSQRLEGLDLKPLSPNYFHPGCSDPCT